jgi:hypothetical protein
MAFCAVALVAARRDVYQHRDAVILVVKAGR